MSDKTDPRLDAAMRASARWHRNEDVVDSDDHSLAWFILDAVDAADREAGIVRVDTNDKALVERLAAICGRAAANEVLATLRGSA